jgi:hypothetical protein
MWSLNGNAEMLSTTGSFISPLVLAKPPSAEDPIVEAPTPPYRTVGGQETP